MSRMNPRTTSRTTPRTKPGTKPGNKPVKRSLLLAAVCSICVSGARATAGPIAADGVLEDLVAEGVRFKGTLNGQSELPPNESKATGSVDGHLTGTPGRYVLTFDLVYTGLESGLLDGHIHYAIDPPGSDPRQQEGPIVFDLPDLEDHTTATWRWDDPRFPLSDSLVDSLFDGELYVNLHTSRFRDGEIRGQLGGIGGNGGGGGHPHPIPLPAPVALGAAGLGLVALAKRKRLGLGR